MNLPKPKNNELMFLPLGGSGEIGMNLNLYGNSGKWLIVDCGVTFGDPIYGSVDISMPDIISIENSTEILYGNNSQFYVMYLCEIIQLYTVCPI